ncbi:MAG: MBL fold metallo-hydrolase [Clostridia bacterium]|nr:MBL fold metallo-hydrolase [Clostridia bacterium]
MARRKKKPSILLSLILLILLAIGAWRGGLFGDTRSYEPVEGTLEVHVIDVDQADCTLIIGEAGNILIDAGDVETKDEVKTYLEQLGIRTLTYAIFTHPDSDHIGGAATVIESFEIENVILPTLHESDVPTTKVYERMITALEERESINVIAAEAGAEYEIGELKMKILAPLSDNYSNINDYSVSARFDFGATSFLFTGDALEKSEGEMVKHYPASELRADFFQAGHHGASNANTPDFIRAVSPSIVAVSCGLDNKYGHPTDEALASYAAVGATVYRTDELGTMIFISDGEEITKK